MTIDSRIHATPPLAWRRIGLGLSAALIGGLAQPMAAAEDELEFISIRAAETDTFEVSANGRAALTLTRAPSGSSPAQLHIVNSDNFSLWTGDLQAQGRSWTTTLDLAAVEALLVANAVQAEFPGAATDGKDLRISILHENFVDSLAATAVLLGSKPLFYQAPEAPEALAAIDTDGDATRVSSYAMAARRYDEQLTAYHFQLVAARASAYSLWIDLKTADRLPDWPASLIAAQERAYQALKTKAEGVLAQRDAARATASGIVSGWNSTHRDAEPVELSFRESS